MAPLTSSLLAAIVLAMQNDLLWSDLAGEPVLARTLGVLVASPQVADIVVVTDAARQHDAEQIAREHGWEAQVRVIAPEKPDLRDALAAGLAALPTAAGVICAHDGARALVTAEILAAGMEAVTRTGAASASAPLKETIKRVDSHGMVVATPDRATLYTLQTPQMFARDLLAQALKTVDPAYIPHDAAQIVEQAGATVTLFPGAYTNLRIATAHDLALARALRAARGNA